MNPNKKEDKCALPRCTCSIAAGQLYCCDACREEHASNDPAETCPCGHAECDATDMGGSVDM